MTTQTDNAVRFEEIQSFRQPWLWALLVGVPLVATAFSAAHLIQEPEKALQLTPMLAFFAIWAAILVFLYALKLHVSVDETHLHVRFWPLVSKDIALADIAEFAPRTYRPLLEYGGWGLRYSWHGTAYNVSGNRGVQLVLQNGKRILIGSQKPEELAEAIARGKA